MKRISSALSLLALAALTQASVTINETHINPVGADQGGEFVELLSSSPSESLAGLTLLVVDGDSTSAGVIDQAIDLSTFGTTGSNGMLLIRDSAVVLNPAPDANTNVVVFDFTPDIENGTNSFLLVRGFSGALAMDLDTDNNGVFETTPWTSVDDAYAVIDTTLAGDYMYAAAVGGTNFTYPGFGAGAYAVLPNGNETAFQTSGANPGPYTIFVNAGVPQVANPAGTLLTPPSSWAMTPGSANMAYASVIAPTSYSVTGGIAFGGTLASLTSSDDDKVFILNDEIDATGNINFIFGGVASASSMSVTLETGASRADLSQFTRLFNTATSSYDTLNFSTATISDTVYPISVASPASYVNAATSEVLAQVTWIPQTDIESGDGWTESVDQIVITVTP